MNQQPSTPLTDGLNGVTVVIAAYNAERFIANAIRSALDQTHPFVDVRVVDDCSTDETYSIAKSFERTGRVRVSRNEVNAGPSHTRNRAIQEASGAWVAQLDADDWFAPDRIKTLLELATRTEADVVADDQALVLDGGGAVQSTRFLDNGFGAPEDGVVLRKDFVRYDLGSMKPMIRTSFLRNEGVTLYPTEIRYGEDFIFLFRLLSRGARFVVSDRPKYYLRRGNTGSLTRNRESLFSSLEAGTNALIDECRVNRDSAGEEMLRSRLKGIRLLGAAERSIRLRRLPFNGGPGGMVFHARAIFYKARSSTMARYRRYRYLKNKLALAAL